MSAPFLERAERAAAQEDWPEVVRLTEHILYRFEGNQYARALLIQARINLGEFALAESETAFLDPDRRERLMQEIRQRWVAEKTPEASLLAEWKQQTNESEWLELVRTGVFRIEAREGRSASLRFLNALNALVADNGLRGLTLDYLAYAEDIALERSLLRELARNNQLETRNAIRLAHLLTDSEATDEVERILRERSEAPWFSAFRQAHLDRLVGAKDYAAAIARILREWDWEEMPEAVRGQLVDLAFLAEDVDLVARPDLRPPEECLESVAWLGPRSPAHAESLLRTCNRSLDPDRWNFLASLYAPALADPSILSPEEYARRQRALREAEAVMALRQREQDALDAAWEGTCPDKQAFSGAIRDELLALCLRDTLPGAATVFFDRALADREHPRRERLLRAAAFSNYQAADFDASLAYWAQLDDPTEEDERAIGATAAARSLLDVKPEDTPLLSLEALLSAAESAPDTYARELGMRLSGQADSELRQSAIPWLKRGRPHAPYDFRLPEALSYRYFEAGETELSTINAQSAIDGLDPALAVGPATPDELTQRQFSLRRSHQFMTQRNRLYVASTWARSGVPAAIGGEQTADVFQIINAEHLLGDAPTVSGRQLGIYARALSSNIRRDEFFADPAFGVGLRWKPIGERDINSYAEFFRSPDGRNDLMLRASAGLLNSGSVRDDWRAGKQHWTWQVLYLDGAYFVDSEIYQLFGSYQLGHDFKLSASTPHTLSPYVTAFHGESNNFSDSVVGAGLRYRLWFSEDRYNAWRNRVDIRAEANYSVSGFQQGETGWRILLELML
ncbi:MAG: hypothetical protein ABR578_07700 [Chromatocurvus sp.]